MIAQVVPVTRLRRDTTSWSYRIPARVAVSAGSLVSISFHGRLCLGVVWELVDQDEKAEKPIEEVITHNPLLTLPQRQFIEWLSQMGLCSLSTALYAWLPRSLRQAPLRSTTLSLIQQFDSSLSTKVGTPIPQHAILIPSYRESMSASLKSKFKERFSELIGERTEKQELLDWLAIARGDLQVGVGREGSLFAPWRNLRRCTVVEPEDISYFHEQSPYVNMVEAATALSTFHRSELQLRSHLPEEAAQLLWPRADGIAVNSTSINITDLCKEPLLNTALAAAIKDVLQQDKTVIVLYNSKDRRKEIVEQGQRSEVAVPGVETIRKQLFKLFQLPESFPHLIVGTRSIFNQPLTNVGLTVALSLEPLLGSNIFADQVHGWSDLGHLLSFSCPCRVQSFNQAHPLIESLRNNQFASYCTQQIQAQKEAHLPPFSQYIGVSTPSEFIESGELASFRGKLHSLVEPPWELSFPISTIWHKKSYQTLLLHTLEPDTRLPRRLRAALIAQPRPWKVQRNPWHIL
jgi:primosomal protein N'